jgi:type II secretory pathway component PulJ
MPRPRCHRDLPAQGQLLGRGGDGWNRARGGGVLFEVMLSIALFAAAAAFTLGAVRSVYHTLERSEKRQQAVDLARTRLAELEAGLITLRDLQGESHGAADSPASASRDASSFDERATARPRWRLEARTTRTEFTGLTLVELTVIENIPPEAEAAGASAMQYTLRQLVAVREDEDEAWQEDDLVRGLPTESGHDGDER